MRVLRAPGEQQLAGERHHQRRGEERAGLAVICDDDETAREVADEAGWYAPASEVGFVPSRGVAYGSGLEPAPHLVGERARGLGLLRSIDDIGNIVLTSQHGTPVLVKDVATVTISALPREGIVGQDSEPDIVNGIVLMRKGENPPTC